MLTSRPLALPILCVSVALASSVATTTVGAATEIDIPELVCDPTQGLDQNCLYFDDFTVLSLGYLQHLQSDPFNLYSGYDFLAKPGDAVVKILNKTIIGTDNQGINKGVNTGIDDPFDSMNGNTSDNMRFLMVADSLTSVNTNDAIPSDPEGGPFDRIDTSDPDPNNHVTVVIDNRVGLETTVTSAETFTQQKQLYNKNDETKIYNDETCYPDLRKGDLADTGDWCLTLWDAEISKLRELITGDELLFLFLMNDDNKPQAPDENLLGQDQLVWARVTLTDLNDNGDVIGQQTFTLSGTEAEDDYGAFGLTMAQDQEPVVGEDPNDANFDGFETGTDILPTVATGEPEEKWAYVHAEICQATANGTGYSVGDIYLGECSKSSFDPGDRVSINQALGEDEAGFAAFNSKLSDLVLDPNSTWDILTVDVRNAYLNNGPEQLWIASGDRTTVNGIPEPSGIALLGAGLVGLRFARRRRSKA